MASPYILSIPYMGGGATHILCILPQYIDCKLMHQFSDWCIFPCEEWGSGALCRCCIRSRRTARRPFFLRFPARGGKAVHGPRAAGGGAPPRRKLAPPARAEQGARGGRGRSAPTRARRNSRGSTAPQVSTGHVRGQRISEGSRRGGVRGGRPLGGHSMPRIPRTGGLGGRPCGATLPERRGSRLASRGHEERVQKTISSRPAASERAAQRARAPPTRRIRLRRGFVEGSNSSIRCAAAWQPVVHALPRILPPDYFWVRSSAWEMMLHAASQPCT